MKKTILALISFFVLSSVYAQQTWQWATNNLGNKAWANVTDANGNQFITGVFSGTLIIASDTLVCDYNGDIFIAKVNSFGIPVWGVRAGGHNLDPHYEQGSAITLDNFGNLYVMGTFFQLAVFGLDTLTTSGGNGVSNFLAKLDTSGNFLWAQKLGGNDFLLSINSNKKIPSGVSTDNLGNIYVTGAMRGTGIFDTISLSITNQSTVNMFIAKYNSAGSCLWAKRAGNNYWSSGCSIKADVVGNSYAAGYFAGGTIMFDTIQETVLSTGGAIFIIKYNTLGVAEMVTGDYVFSNVNDGDYQSPNGIDIDNMNNIYVTGTFIGSAFGLVSASPSYPNMFTIKLNSSGSLLWAKKGGGSNFNGDWGQDIVADDFGNCYVTGSVNSGNAIFTPFTPVKGLFVIAYNSSGTALWIKQPSGTGNYTSNGFGIDIDGSNCIYIAGYFIGDTVSFGSTYFYNTGGGVTAKINHSTQLIETTESKSVNLYPSPVTNELIVQGAELQLIEIYNTVGKKVFSQQNTYTQQQTSIDVSQLGTGIYFVITNQNGNKAVRKFVKM